MVIALIERKARVKHVDDNKNIKITKKEKLKVGTYPCPVYHFTNWNWLEGRFNGAVAQENERERERERGLDNNLDNRKEIDKITDWTVEFVSIKGQLISVLP